MEKKHEELYGTTLLKIVHLIIIIILFQCSKSVLCSCYLSFYVYVATSLMIII